MSELNMGIDELAGCFVDLGHDVQSIAEGLGSTFSKSYIHEPNQVDRQSPANMPALYIWRVELPTLLRTNTIKKNEK